MNLCTLDGLDHPEPPDEIPYLISLRKKNKYENDMARRTTASRNKIDMFSTGVSWASSGGCALRPMPPPVLCLVRGSCLCLGIKCPKPNTLPGCRAPRGLARSSGALLALQCALHYERVGRYIFPAELIVVFVCAR